MKHSKRETILHELKHHLPFTLTVSLLAGVLVALIFLFDLGSNALLGDMFEVAHPLHVLVSATATAAIYYKYKKSILSSLVIGAVGSIFIGTLSDILLPWVAGNLISLNTGFHLPILEEPILIIGASIIGAIGGIRFGMFKISHTLHIFLSVFASLFYLLAFSSAISLWMILIVSLIVFLVVYIPCCISDIVLPLMFIRKPCHDCGYWHE